MGAQKVVKKTPKGTITTNEGIEFDVWRPDGGHIQKHGKQVFAEDELNSRE